MNPSTEQPDQAPKKNGSYGSRPKWHWALLYVILAIVVYGLIFLIFFHHGGSSTSSSGY
ncbi:MAG TPA: hypothetical protein VNE40_02015 [Candidatus Dormibacteraeota bacterium]|nr:hypothetical protein [Candidatus Dormibacteraeota bacterium]